MANTSRSAGEPSNPPPAEVGRVESVDLLRGLVMVVMLLDHVRDFFGNAQLDPLDLETTTPALFLTRWVTHYCAPTFLLLAGISASFAGERRTLGELSRHLAVRGLWLIFLEQTWVYIFVFFDHPRMVFGVIFWAIGWSMILLAGLIHLPRVVIGAVGLAMIGLHNGLDGVTAPPGPLSLGWGFLHSVGMQFLPGGLPVLIGYPLIPWVGVMAVGYALGPIFHRPAGRRRAWLMVAGLVAVAGFVGLRWLDRYGDPRPWSVQATPLLTVLSFLNVTKNPPSLLYLLVTLGPAMLALAALDRGLGRWAEPLRTLGRVPLFFYMLQWPVAHGLAVVVEAAQGHPIGWMFGPTSLSSPPGYGQSLAKVYLFWFITLIILYRASAWYDRRRGRARSRKPGRP